MKRYYFYRLLLPLLLLPLVVFSQQDPSLEKLLSYAKNIRDFNHLYPQEKVFLHFDNTGYFVGENIWFKAYITTAEQHQLTELSRILYVELLTQEGKLVETLKLKIENGQCYGDFRLKPEYRSGFYEVRAYTRAMLNFGDDCIFSRVLPVYNEPEGEGEYNQKEMRNPYNRNIENSRKKPEKLKDVNVDFYPEGGNLIQGLSNRIAFKVTGKQGENLEVSGKLLDPNGQEISAFSTIHQGMGIFSFVPEEGKYRAVITYQNRNYNFDLPVTLPMGYTMQLNNFRDDKLNIQIDKTPGLSAEILGLSITCRGKLCYFDTLRVDTETWKSAIPKQALPEGVHCISLFNERGEVLSERLFFVKQPQEVFLTYQQNKKRYNPMEEIRLDFTVVDKDEQPVTAGFSVSVRDASSSPVGAYEDNIYTNLLLSSELKGYIEQPAYYFESNDNAHKYALDLLMMTQGWRRYAWKRLAGIDPLEIKHDIEETLMIKGKALNLNNEKPQGNVTLSYFLMKDSLPGVSGEGQTAADGSFTFLLDDTLTLKGEWNLTLQTYTKGKLLKSRILLDRQFSPPGRTYFPRETANQDTIRFYNEEDEEPKTDDEEAIEPEDGRKRSLNEVQQLKTVTVKARRKPRSSYPNDVYRVNRDIDATIDQEKPPPTSIIDYLMKSDDGFYYGCLNSKDDPGCNNPQYVYDGKKINLLFDTIGNRSFDPDLVTSIDDFSAFNSKALRLHGVLDLLTDIKRVESISVYRTIPNPPPGAPKFVLVYVQLKSKEDAMKYNDFPNGTRLTQFDGYSYTREFSKVVAPETLPATEDFRRTLYWNPNVKTDDNGKVSLEFFNNSNARNILINCEGMTENEKIINMQNY